jgi:hypothetical protein
MKETPIQATPHLSVGYPLSCNFGFFIISFWVQCVCALFFFNRCQEDLINETNILYFIPSFMEFVPLLGLSVYN